MTISKITLIVLLAVLLSPMASNAGLIEIATQGDLDAAGNITQNTNWDTYGTGFTHPGSPFVVGDITFVAGGTNVIGGIDGYGMDRALLTDDNVLGTESLIANTYDLLGFNAGNFFSAADALFTITTNLSTYDFTYNVLSYASGGTLTFFGFQATGGEYIESFAWSGSGATGLTDIQIGTTSVPEPSTLAIFGIGLLGMATSRRRKQI